MSKSWAYLQSEGKCYLPALEWATELIRGFETPLGMVLAMVDSLLLLQKDGWPATVAHSGRTQAVGSGDGIESCGYSMIDSSA